jgi:hypothetical protein
MFSGYQIEKNGMVGAYGTMEESRGVYRTLVGKPEGNNPAGRPRPGWEDNIKLHF